MIYSLHRWPGWHPNVSHTDSGVDGEAGLTSRGVWWTSDLAVRLWVSSWTLLNLGFLTHEMGATTLTSQGCGCTC